MQEIITKVSTEMHHRLLEKVRHHVQAMIFDDLDITADVTFVQDENEFYVATTQDYPISARRLGIMGLFLKEASVSIKVYLNKTHCRIEYRIYYRTTSGGHNGNRHSKTFSLESFEEVT